MIVSEVRRISRAIRAFMKNLRGLNLSHVDKYACSLSAYLNVVKETSVALVFSYSPRRFGSIRFS